MRRGAVIGICLAALAAPVGAYGDDIPPKQAFVVRFKEAIRSNDRAWLADHARYPVRYFGRTKRLIRTRAAFIGRYPKLIGHKLRSSVLAQVPDQVFENDQGLMIGDGPINIWVRQRGDDPDAPFEIITINDNE